MVETGLEGVNEALDLEWWRGGFECEHLRSSGRVGCSFCWGAVAAGVLGFRCVASLLDLGQKKAHRDDPKVSPLRAQWV